jgi:hypothetical protein
MREHDTNASEKRKFPARQQCNFCLKALQQSFKPKC